MSPFARRRTPDQRNSTWTLRSFIPGTNAIESLNVRYRRTDNQSLGHCPPEQAALKFLYLITWSGRDRHGPHQVDDAVETRVPHIRSHARRLAFGSGDLLTINAENTVYGIDYCPSVYSLLCELPEVSSLPPETYGLCWLTLPECANQQFTRACYCGYLYHQRKGGLYDSWDRRVYSLEGRRLVN